MSPDETPTEPQIDVGEAEVKPKKSMKERFAFLDKTGESMDNVKGINKIPRSMRVLVLLVAVILIGAIIWIAWPSGDEPTPEPDTVNIDQLEDWSWSSGSSQVPLLNEGSTGTHALSALIDANTTVFIESVDVTITWTDEPDGSIGPRQKENQPDTFQLEINSSASDNMSAMSEEISNTHGTSGTITVSINVADSGYSYLVMGNTTDLKLGDDVLTGDINVLVHMIVAGDHTSQPQILIINDVGNEYSIDITVNGKSVPE
jgi:hypothetical protein